MREIKFRLWNTEELMYFDLETLQRDFKPINAEYPIMQYTGLKDRNGKEI